MDRISINTRSSNPSRNVSVSANQSDNSNTDNTQDKDAYIKELEEKLRGKGNKNNKDKKNNGYGNRRKGSRNKGKEDDSHMKMSEQKAKSGWDVFTNDFPATLSEWVTAANILFQNTMVYIGFSLSLHLGVAPNLLIYFGNTMADDVIRSNNRYYVESSLVPKNYNGDTIKYLRKVITDAVFVSTYYCIYHFETTCKDKVDAKFLQLMGRIPVVSGVFNMVMLCDKKHYSPDFEQGSLRINLTLRCQRALRKLNPKLAKVIETGGDDCETVINNAFKVLSVLRSNMSLPLLYFTMQDKVNYRDLGKISEVIYSKRNGKPIYFVAAKHPTAETIAAATAMEVRLEGTGILVKNTYHNVTAKGLNDVVTCSVDSEYIDLNAPSAISNPESGDIIDDNTRNCVIGDDLLSQVCKFYYNNDKDDIRYFELIYFFGYEPTNLSLPSTYDGSNLELPGAPSGNPIGGNPSIPPAGGITGKAKDFAGNVFERAKEFCTSDAAKEVVGSIASDIAFGFIPRSVFMTTGLAAEQLRKIKANNRINRNYARCALMDSVGPSVKSLDI